MRIGLDLDGTTVQFWETFCDRYVAWFGLDDPRDQPTAGDWDNITSCTHFESFTEALAWADRARVYEDVAWVPGAPAFIERALADGHEVVFLTARNGISAIEQSWKWFHGRFSKHVGPRDRLDMVTSLSKKSTVSCDLYIDDSPGVIDELVSAGKEVYVFDRPWNQPSVLASNPNLYQRIHSWPEATFLILGEKAEAA